MKDFVGLFTGFLTLWLGAFCVASGVLVALKVFGII